MRGHRDLGTGLALAVALSLVAGCSPAASSGAPAAASPGAAESASPPAAPTFDPAGLAKLDDASRGLLAVLEPGEWGRAYVDPVNLERAVIVARATGFNVADPGGPADALHLTGPVEAIIRLAADPSVRLVSLDEDQRATRVVAAPLPGDAMLPVPGAPYRGVPLPFDPGRDLSPDRAAPLLLALGRSIVTLDGQPYQRIEGGVGCEPPTDPVLCNLSVTGWRIAANGFSMTDEWSATEVTKSGPDPRVKALTLGAIPRPLAREAERVARADAGAAVRIADYTSIGSFTWAPGPPLEIAIHYTRPCQVTGRAGRSLTASVGLTFDLMDTSTCVHVLSALVDMTTRKVIAINEARP